MPIEDEKEGRLSRWSKRKLAVAEEEATESIVVVDDAEQDEREAELLANREAAEAVDLETLSEETDFSIFMKDGVPEILKRKAMATLWRTNPVFANVDGLVDYDDDFGSPDLIMKTFKSAYQAGRGYLEHVEREAEKKAAAAAAALAEKGSESPSDEIEKAAVDDPEIADESEGEIVEVLETATGEQSDEVVELETVEAAEAVEADEFLPEEPTPRVSLRRRLELEQGA